MNLLQKEVEKNIFKKRETDLKKEIINNVEINPANADILIQEFLEKNGQSGILNISLSKIKIKNNPRKNFDKTAMDELASSIEKNGLLQPILLDKNNNLIAGERRVRAFKKLGKKTIPAIIYSSGTKEYIILSLVENIQRENLSFFELGTVYKKLIKTGLKQIEIARLLGKPKSHISEAIKISGNENCENESLKKSREKIRQNSENSETTKKVRRAELFRKQIFNSFFNKIKKNYKYETKENGIFIYLEKNELEKINDIT